MSDGGGIDERDGQSYEKPSWQGDSAASGVKSEEITRSTYVGGCKEGERERLLDRGWTVLKYRAGEGQRERERESGDSRTWCLVFIVPANRSITDSDTAQLGNPHRRSQPTHSPPPSPSFRFLLRLVFLPTLSFRLALSRSPSFARLRSTPLSLY